MSNDAVHLKISGHCTIKDFDTQEVLVEQDNAINYETVGFALALALADRPNGAIMRMLFGNGASSVSATGVITYLPPNVTGPAATLYNQTYAQFVNDQSPTDLNTVENFIAVNHTTGTTYSDVVVTCLLDYNQPSDQQAFDNAVQVNGKYIFDEIGLATYNTSTSTGTMLSHVIFHPVQKALDRRVQIVYSLRLVMA